MADPTPTFLALCSENLTAQSCRYLDVVASMLNSAFSTALLGSLAGAFAGAIAAQRIVEGAKAKDELFKELRNTNAAAMASFVACNSALATKKQNVKPILDEYKRHHTELQTFKQSRKTGQRQGNARFQVLIDMRTFVPPSLPLQQITDLVFNKVSATGRPLAAVSAIEQAHTGLKTVIMGREALIEKMKSGQIPKDEQPNYYFGQKLESGDVNMEYPNLLESIESYLNDIIFFTHLLGQDLVKHAESLHKKLSKRQRRNAPKPVESDFSGPIGSGLMPPTKDYEAWLLGFKERSASS